MLLFALAMAAAVADGPASPPSPAAPPSATAAAKPVTDANDPNKMICRREEVTGSHFERRVCMTRADWDRQSAAAEVLERQMNERSATNGGNAPP